VNTGLIFLIRAFMIFKNDFYQILKYHSKFLKNKTTMQNIQLEGKEEQVWP